MDAVVSYLNGNPVISIVLGSYNRKNFLKLTINSIREEQKRLNVPSEIIVIDGGSTDGSSNWLVKQKDVISIIQHNRGSWNGKQITQRSWGYFMNLAFKCAKGKYICMISDDCLIVPNAITNGYKLFEAKSNSEKIGALAFFWREWPRDQKYHVGLVAGNNLFVNHGMYLKKALEEVNYFDEEKYSFYCADGDLCLRLREKGYQTLASPDSYIEHYSHANFKLRTLNFKKFEKDNETFCKTWENRAPQKEKPNWDIKIFEDKTKTGNTFKKAEFMHASIIYNKFKNIIRKNIFKKVQ
jgi:GT2 family glycosyltransferase